MNRVVQNIDHRLTVFSNIMTGLGFNGQEQFDYSRLTRNDTINQTLQRLNEIKSVIDNSGLDNEDKIMVINELRG